MSAGPNPQDLELAQMLAQEEVLRIAVRNRERSWALWHGPRLKAAPVDLRVVEAVAAWEPCISDSPEFEPVKAFRLVPVEDLPGAGELALDKAKRLG